MDLDDRREIARLPRFDAAITYDVLLHQMAPDRDEFHGFHAEKVDTLIVWISPCGARAGLRPGSLPHDGSRFYGDSVHCHAALFRKKNGPWESAPGSIRQAAVPIPKSAPDDYAGARFCTGRRLIQHKKSGRLGFARTVVFP